MKKIKKIWALLLIAALSVSILAGCGKKKEDNNSNVKLDPDNLVSANVDDKYGSCYQVFIYSFCDSDGDGIGDFNGLTSKLDYIKDLGFDSIWLLPFHKSPTYHKYDVIDYYSIDEEYGTMEDFDKFIAACKEKNIDVYMDLVINHTSSRHDWFKTAREYIKGLKEGEEPDYSVCPEAEYYNFNKEGGNGYTKIPGDGGWYYESQFQSGMPDLNLDCKALRTEIEKIAKFWYDKGIRGYRLDAALHYYEGNNDKSTEALKWFYDYVESLDSSNYVVAEVWSDASALDKFYKSGVDSLFNFPYGTSEGYIVLTCNRAGNGSGGGKFANFVVNRYVEVKAIDSNYIDAVFLGNHDTGRPAGFLKYNENAVKFGAALQFFTPGKTFVYYGDELGMTGTGKDENKRAPMYWTENENTAGMTKGPSAMEKQEHRFGSYETQKDDKLSIYNYYKKALLIKNAFPSIGRGTPEALTKLIEQDGNLYALSYTIDNEKTYVICNDSEEATTVTVSKSDYSYTGIAATLSVSEEEASLDGEKLTIPAFGCVILK